jgi:cytochrome c oxidase cbb3-type subunit 3
MSDRIQAARGLARRLAKSQATVSFVMLLCVACEREARRFQDTPPGVRVDTISQSPLRPGPPTDEAPPPPPSFYDENAFTVSEGQRLFGWYNCVGCHAHGGGGIGPPLMDDRWIYGPQAENIFATIVQGRPNGMPSFRGKIPDSQVWQIVAYVRSLSGLVRKDVAPPRADEMSARKPPASTKAELPQ